MLLRRPRAGRGVRCLPILARMRRTHVLAVAALVAACGAAAWSADPVAYDDAYISYRYADNAVRGLGVVFNPGERVEGYTNFAWTAIHALPERLGWSPSWAMAPHPTPSGSWQPSPDGGHPW